MRNRLSFSSLRDFLILYRDGHSCGVGVEMLASRGAFLLALALWRLGRHAVEVNLEVFIDGGQGMATSELVHGLPDG
eukprot:653050-Pleurochrysis_carterae.AAC.1